MAVRLGLSRSASAAKLLWTVDNKEYAGREDHEEEVDKEASPVDFEADPASSDDDKLKAPPKRPKPIPSSAGDNEEGLRKPPVSSKKRKAELDLPGREAEPGLRNPKAKKTRNTAPRPPPPGRFAQSRTAKEELDAEKENSTANSAPANSSQGNAWGFDSLLMESSQGSQKGRKADYSSKSRVTSNIHAAPPSEKKQSKGTTKYGARSKKQKVPIRDSNSDSDTVSMLSDPLDEEQLEDLGVLVNLPKAEPEDPELRNVPRKQKSADPTARETTEPSTMTDTELKNLRKPTLREQLGLTNDSYGSLSESSVPQDDMDHIDSYVRELPAESDEDTACPICHELVSQEAYWQFWKGVSKTVKNQALFCHTHKKATAQSDYTAEGFPPIDWPALPSRIKQHRMALYSILSGETPSTHRTRYAPLALTGKAAAVPSKRIDLPASTLQNITSHALDDTSIYPGYYGPRGRRAITESVMSLLRAEIKRSTDPVVQTSGPATFVQAVLVPEVAVRLIMQDVKCDCEEAEEIRERTWEMGVLLHEEIEDEVVVGDEEGEEGGSEYVH